MFLIFKPDLLNWHKEGKSYVRNDGLARIEKRNNQWIPSMRTSMNAEWSEAKVYYLSLHAAQDHCRRATH